MSISFIKLFAMEYTKTIFNSTFLNIILLSLYLHLAFFAVKAEDCAISNAFEMGKVEEDNLDEVSKGKYLKENMNNSPSIYFGICYSKPQ